MLFNNFNIDILIRLLISCICGLIIGFERENKNKFAGIRTHMIVSLGACMAMIVSKYGFSDAQQSYEASRIASQVVSGIGFLGAGVIFVKNAEVSGLTTAAGIWTTSIIGLSFGAGLYFVGVVVTLLILIIQSIIYRFEVFHMSGKSYIVRINFSDDSMIQKTQEYLRNNKIDLKSLEVEYLKESCELTIIYLSKNEQERKDLIDFLRNNTRINKMNINRV